MHVRSARSVSPRAHFEQQWHALHTVKSDIMEWQGTEYLTSDLPQFAYKIYQEVLSL